MPRLTAPKAEIASDVFTGQTAAGIPASPATFQTCLDAMSGGDTPKRAEARAFMLAEYGVTICSEDDPIEVDVLWAEEDDGVFPNADGIWVEGCNTVDSGGAARI